MFANAISENKLAQLYDIGPRMGDYKLANEISEQSRNGRYLGTVRLALSAIKFETEKEGFIFPDRRRVDALKRQYELVGVGRSLRENHMEALIDDDLLLETTSKLGMTKDCFFQEQDGLHPELALPDGCFVYGLQGRHRLQAAREFLPHEADQWWTVRLYSSGTSITAQHHIRDSYMVSTNPSDGEIYRRIRMYALQNCQERERHWRGRLTGSKRKKIKELSSHSDYVDGFDKLLPLAGLWKGFVIGGLNRLNSMRCREEILCYLNHIRKVWSYILDDDQELMGLTDENTVETLACHAPAVAWESASEVSRLMKSNEIFPLIKNPTTREGITNRLYSIRCLIPTIMTFFEDIKYLEPCSRIMEHLSGHRIKMGINTEFRKRKDSLYESLVGAPVRSLKTTAEALFPVETSEGHLEQEKKGFLEHQQDAYNQLWLFTMRHFPEMTEYTTKKECGKKKPNYQVRPELWNNFGQLASSLGFDTRCLSQYPFSYLIENLVFKLRPPEAYDYSPSGIQCPVEQISRSLQGAAPKISGLSRDPEFTSDRSLHSSRKRGIPYDDSHKLDKEFLFLNQMRKQYISTRVEGNEVSTFFVKRNFFISFFCPTETFLIPEQRAAQNTRSGSGIEVHSTPLPALPNEFTFRPPSNPVGCPPVFAPAIVNPAQRVPIEPVRTHITRGKKQVAKFPLPGSKRAPESAHRKRLPQQKIRIGTPPGTSAINSSNDIIPEVQPSPPTTSPVYFRPSEEAQRITTNTPSEIATTCPSGTDIGGSVTPVTRVGSQTGSGGLSSGKPLQTALSAIPPNIEIISSPAIDIRQPEPKITIEAQPKPTTKPAKRSLTPEPDYRSTEKAPRHRRPEIKIRYFRLQAGNTQGRKVLLAEITVGQRDAFETYINDLREEGLALQDSQNRGFHLQDYPLVLGDGELEFHIQIKPEFLTPDGFIDWGQGYGSDLDKIARRERLKILPLFKRPA